MRKECSFFLIKKNQKIKAVNKMTKIFPPYAKQNQTRHLV
jgi:hypothetical protein